MLTADEISYIVEWAKSGNKPRLEGDIPYDLGGAYYCNGLLDEDTDEPSWIVSGEGLTIAALAEENAKLREAFVQACDTAEHSGHGDLWTMRKNRRELIGE